MADLRVSAGSCVPEYSSNDHAREGSGSGPAMELIFREIQCGDVESLFSVRARTRENPASIVQLATLGITPESSTEAIASGRVRGWLCTDAGAVVGFCTGHSETGEVLVLAVLPDHEARGIGRRLLALVVEWLRSSHRNIWLAASPNPDVRAYGFYAHSAGTRPARDYRTGTRFSLQAVYDCPNTCSL